MVCRDCSAEMRKEEGNWYEVSFWMKNGLSTLIVYWPQINGIGRQTHATTRIEKCSETLIGILVSRIHQRYTTIW